MKIKDGKELSQIALIKRLNLMGIDYNKKILGKNYYIDLYNKAIKLKNNQDKIRTELNKDEEYANFYNDKLKKRNECLINISNSKASTNSNSNLSNKCSLSENENKGFFSDYNFDLVNKTILAHFCVNSFDYLYEKIPKNLNNTKLFFPFQAIKKCTSINIIPKIKKLFIEIVNYICDNLRDKFDILQKIILIILVIVMIIQYKIQKRTKNR